jgi:hypothetical protein
VRPIAIGLVGRLLAAAEINGLGLVCGEGNRFEGAALVRAVAKRLSFAASTGAPVVSPALDDFDWERLFGGNNRFFTHVFLFSIKRGDLNVNHLWMPRQ